MEKYSVSLRITPNTDTLHAVGAQSLFQPRPLSEIFTIVKALHAASKIWSCAIPEVKLYLMKLSSRDNNFKTDDK